MGRSVSSRNQTGTSSSTISTTCSPKFSLCFVPSWWLQSSPSLGIKEVDCQIVPQASAPRPPRSPRSSAPVTPPCSSTTATPPTAEGFTCDQAAADAGEGNPCRAAEEGEGYE